MGAENIPRLMARFAAPALAGMLANALYNITDRIFVGQIVGPLGIAAIAVSFPCMLFFNCVAMLIGTGAASRVSILLGEGKKDGAERTFGSSVALALVLGAALMVFGYLMFGRILLMSGASAAIYPMADEYLSCIITGTIFGIMSFSISYQIRACGSPSYAMGTQVVGAAANIALDAVFVMVFGMGVRGAAIATVISQGISLCWALAYFRLPNAGLRLRVGYVIKPDITSLGRIFAVGIPASLVQLNFVFVHGMITNASSSYGGDIAVSATGILMGLDSLLFMPAVALGEACTPIVGYNYGAGNTERVVDTVKKGMMITTVFYMISFTVIMLRAPALAKLFNSDDAELIRLTAVCMKFANAAIPVMSVSIICTSLLQGLGMGRAGLALAFVRFGVFLWIPLLILPRHYGIYGAWGSFPISDAAGSVVSAAVMIYTIRRLRKKTFLKDPPGR
jgi:putative MATE family efflux protein